jgi:hypothetical protein
LFLDGIKPQGFSRAEDWHIVPSVVSFVILVVSILFFRLRLLCPFLSRLSTLNSKKTRFAAKSGS